MPVTRVGRRGQITLPRAVRHALKIQEGDRIAFVQRGEEVVLQPMKQTLLDLRGSVPVSEPQDFDAIRQQVRNAHAQRTAEDAS